MVNLGMNEYLSKEFIEKILDAHMLDSNGAEHYAYSTLKHEFMAAPGADVVEAKHGRWIPVHHNGDLTGGKCSVCGKFKKTYNMGTLYNGYKVCHNCGAKMDGVVK